MSVKDPTFEEIKVIVSQEDTTGMLEYWQGYVDGLLIKDHLSVEQHKEIGKLIDERKDAID